MFVGGRKALFLVLTHIHPPVTLQQTLKSCRINGSSIHVAKRKNITGKWQCDVFANKSIAFLKTQQATTFSLFSAGELTKRLTKKKKKPQVFTMSHFVRFQADHSAIVSVICKQRLAAATQQIESSVMGQVTGCSFP